MANRYWVGGTNTWNGTATGKWATTSGGASGAAVPTAADDVFFDASSSGTVTLTTNMVARSINCTGFTGTISHPASTQLNIGDGTAGASNIALKLVAGMTYTVGNTGTSIIAFNSTSATQQTIDFGGKVAPTFSIVNTTGNYLLSTSMSQLNGSTVNLNSGTLDTNNVNHTWGSFQSSNSTTRTLTLGSSVITLVGASWDMTTVTGLTFNAGTSSIIWNPTTGTPAFAAANQTFYDMSCIKSSGGFNFNGSGTISFRHFTMDNAVLGGGNRAITINTTGGLIFSGVFTYKGATSTNSGYLVSGGTGSPRTIALGATGSTDFVNIDFRDIVITGTAAPVSGTRLGDGGGNTGITFPASKNMYWVHSGSAGASISWNSTTNWSLTSGGASAGEIPLIHDYAIFNASSFPNTGQIVTMGNLRAAGFDASAATNSPTFRFTNPSGGGNTHYGDMIFPTAGSTIDAVGAAGGATSMTLLGRGTHIIDPNGAPFGAAISLAITSVGGSYTLGDNFTLASDRSLALNFGTFNANGYNVSVGTFSSSNAAVRTLNMGSGTWYITGTGGTIWSMTTITNLTMIAGTSTVDFSNGTGSGTRVYAPGATLNNVKVSAGTDTFQNSGIGMTCKDLDFTGFSGTWDGSGHSISGNFTLGTGMTVLTNANGNTYTGSGTNTITMNGVQFNRPMTFNGTGTWTLQDDLDMGGASQRLITLTQGTLTVGANDINASSFASANTNVRTLNMGSGVWTLYGGNNSPWNTGTSTNLTINPETAIVQFTYSGSTGTRTMTGAGFARKLGNVYITAGTDTVTLNDMATDDLDFTGFSGRITTLTNATNVSGNLTIPSGVISVIGGVSFAMRATSGTKTITTSGVFIDNPISIDAPGATIQLADHLTMGNTRQLGVTQGTFDANNKNVTAGNFSSSNSNVRTILMGSGTWTLTSTASITIWQTSSGTNLTLNAGTSMLVISNTALAKNIDRTNGTDPTKNTFYDVHIAAGAGIVSFRNANTSWIHNLTADPGAKIRFNSPAIYNFTGTTFPSGTSGNLTTVDTNNAGVAATISGTGTFTSDYLSVKDLTATGGADWIAGYNSVDNGGNTGWRFPGQIKYYNGTAFINKPVKYWDGTTWVKKPIKYYDGSTWVASGS